MPRNNIDIRLIWQYHLSERLMLIKPTSCIEKKENGIDGNLFIKT